MFNVEQPRYFFHYETNPLRLSHLNLSRKTTLTTKLIECFKILNDFTNVDTDRLLVVDDSMRTRNNGAKLKCRQIHSDCTKFFFTNAVILDCSRPPPSVVQCNSIASFKNNLDRYLIHVTKTVSASWWPLNNGHSGLG